MFGVESFSDGIMADIVTCCNFWTIILVNLKYKGTVFYITLVIYYFIKMNYFQNIKLWLI